MNYPDEIKKELLEYKPPEFLFATYNRITSEKSIEVYQFNGHDDSKDIHLQKKLKTIRECLC